MPLWADIPHTFLYCGNLHNITGTRRMDHLSSAYVYTHMSRFYTNIARLRIVYSRHSQETAGYVDTLIFSGEAEPYQP